MLQKDPPLVKPGTKKPSSTRPVGNSAQSMPGNVPGVERSRVPKGKGKVEGRKHEGGDTQDCGKRERDASRDQLLNKKVKANVATPSPPTINLTPIILSVCGLKLSSKFLFTEN